MTRHSIELRNKTFVFAFILFSICSCTTKKDILYFQNSTGSTYPEPIAADLKIETNDILDIKISSLDPVASALYNAGTSSDPTTTLNTADLLKLRGYLVNVEGNITVPALGIIHVKDKTVNELEQFLLNKLVDENHLKNPTVIVRTLNSKVTILGEVRSPGTFNYTEKNLTLLQAIGLAGDLTINGDRTSVMLIRQENEIRTISQINLTSTDWFNTPNYFIKQNDVIVVNPNEAKVKSAGLIGNPATIISVVSLLLTAAILFTR